MGANILGSGDKGYRVDKDNSFNFERMNRRLISVNSPDTVCRHRVAELGRAMQSAGVPFDVYQGYRKGERTRHTWIEYTDYNGKRQVLDPMGWRDHSGFTRFEPVRVNQGVADDEHAWQGILNSVDKERKVKRG